MLVNVVKKWAIHGLFFLISVFSIQFTVNIQYKFLPMTGFEPWTSGIRSDRSTNWATTTAPQKDSFLYLFSSLRLNFELFLKPSPDPLLLLEPLEVEIRVLLQFLHLLLQRTLRRVVLATDRLRLRITYEKQQKRYCLMCDAISALGTG